MNTRRLSIAAAALCILLLPSCKGRTLDNVEPDGETIEVVVEEFHDSAAAIEAVQSAEAAVNDAPAVDSAEVAALTQEQLNAIIPAVQQANSAAQGDE